MSNKGCREWFRTEDLRSGFTVYAFRRILVEAANRIKSRGRLGRWSEVWHGGRVKMPKDVLENQELLSMNWKSSALLDYLQPRSYEIRTKISLWWTCVKFGSEHKDGNIVDIGSKSSAGRFCAETPKLYFLGEILLKIWAMCENLLIFLNYHVKNKATATSETKNEHISQLGGYVHVF